MKSPRTNFGNFLMLMISNRRKFTFFALLLLSLPSVVSAEILISEVMYDLPGLDAKREWVEIVNTGDTNVDLTGWKFFEGDTNHRLTVVMGNALLLSGARAVIADNADAFLSDWPAFSGVLFDSSFSLKNTGELIAIRNAELADINVVAYMSSWGGKGDGTSLQFFETAWKAGSPTPGEPNVMSGVTQPEVTTIINTEQTATVIKTEPETLNPEVSKKSVLAGQPKAVPDSSQETPVESSETDAMFKWLLALGGVLLLATAAVLFLQRKDVVGSEADDIEILD